MKFEPFDDDYTFDKSILIEDFPGYLMPGVKKWVFDTLRKHKLLIGVAGRGQVSDTFLHPLNRALRTNIRSNDTYFFNDISTDLILFRNVLSYVLQNIADIREAKAFEIILSEGSSAYSVEFIQGDEINGFSNDDGEAIFRIIGWKLNYRVPPIVKKQAYEITSNEQLINEAWEAYYGIKPDDEKTVVRCTDAISGLLRDNFFPNEKRPVFGTMLNIIEETPNTYKLPASTIYDTEDMVKLMKQFSKIRGNHQKGTGRMPTHLEAGFVLHLSILLFQIFKNADIH